MRIVVGSALVNVVADEGFGDVRGGGDHRTIVELRENADRNPMRYLYPAPTL